MSLFALTDGIRAQVLATAEITRRSVTGILGPTRWDGRNLARAGGVARAPGARADRGGGAHRARPGVGRPGLPRRDLRGAHGGARRHAQRARGELWFRGSRDGGALPALARRPYALAPGRGAGCAPVGAVAQFEDDVAVVVVLAAAGYPETPRAGDPIEGLADASRAGGRRCSTPGRGAMGPRW